MKEKILNALIKYPNGARLRELASDCHTQILNLWYPISTLIAEGKVRETSVVSYATGENYYLFKLVKPLK